MIPMDGCQITLACVGKWHWSISICVCMCVCVLTLHALMSNTGTVWRNPMGGVCVCVSI